MDDERCLSDSGMPPAEIKATLAYIASGKGKAATANLKMWRDELLKQLHLCQKQIDCLDYFLQNHKEELK